MSPPETHRLILSLPAAQHELETVGVLMASIGDVVAQARQNDWGWMASADGWVEIDISGPEDIVYPITEAACE